MINGLPSLRIPGLFDNMSVHFCLKKMDINCSEDIILFVGFVLQFRYLSAIQDFLRSVYLPSILCDL